MAKFTQTLRGQVITRVTVVLIALLTVLGVAQYALLSRYMVNKAADMIGQQIRSAFKPSPGGSSVQQAALSMGGPGLSVLILDAHGDRLATLGPHAEWMQQQVAALSSASDGTGSVPPQRTPARAQSMTSRVDGESVLLVIDRIPAGPSGSILTAAVVRSTEDIAAYLNFMALMTVLASLTGLLIVMLVLGHLLGRSLQPIGQLAGAAVAIAEGDWSQRVISCGGQEVDQAAYAFNRMVDRLDEAFRTERQQHERMQHFIADAAHELRTPLTALNGFIELMRSGAVSSPANQERALTAMHDESQRMTRLVANLLQIARMDTNQSLTLKPLDLGNLLQEMVPTLQAADQSKPVHLQIEGDAPMLGNPDALKQVVWNLVDNARRYSSTGCPVVVDCRAQGDGTQLSVIDQGVGIRDEEIPHLFDRFWRGDASRARASGGTGLGLSIVQGLVHSHGGTIEVHSKVGKGTTFVIFFPARRA